MVRVTTVAIRTALRFGVLVAGALLAASAADAQKTGGLAFWEPPKADEPILERSPHNDPGRYAALRQAFVEFHCTGDLMQEQPVGPRSDRNLICTLPGQTPDAILVAARYDGKAGAGFQNTWVDAFLLPLLDHALQAQPRRHTFVFAALFGQGGEAAFFNQLRSSGKPLPHALIVLDGLGWGLPLWYTVPSVKATPGHPAELGANGVLGGIAAGLCRVLGIPEPANLTPARFTTEGGYSSAEYYRSQRQESSLFRSAGDIPELLLYTDITDTATQTSTDLETSDIHRDFDYAAWVLCLTDRKLDPPPAAISPAEAPAAAPAATNPATGPATSAPPTTPQR
jgi:hypothetical protein